MAEFYSSRIFELEDFELEKFQACPLQTRYLPFYAKEMDPSPDFKNKISLVLDDIQDPGNFGTLVRIADWFGIENIICSLHTTELYNPKVVQSSMASLGRVNIIYCNLEDFLRRKNKKYAAVLDGKPLHNFTALKEAFIIIGNEAKGMKKNWLHYVKRK